MTKRSGAAVVLLLIPVLAGGIGCVPRPLVASDGTVDRAGIRRVAGRVLALCGDGLDRVPAVRSARPEELREAIRAGEGPLVDALRDLDLLAGGERAGAEPVVNALVEELEGAVLRPEPGGETPGTVLVDPGGLPGDLAVTVVSRVRGRNLAAEVAVGRAVALGRVAPGPEAGTPEGWATRLGRATHLGQAGAAWASGRDPLGVVPVLDPPSPGETAATRAVPLLVRAGTGRAVEEARAIGRDEAAAGRSGRTGTLLPFTEPPELRGRVLSSPVEAVEVARPAVAPLLERGAEVEREGRAGDLGAWAILGGGEDARDLAGRWRGGSYRVLDDGSLVWVTAWASRGAAREFVRALDPMLEGEAVVRTRDTGVVLLRDVPEELVDRVARETLRGVPGPIPRDS